MQVTVGKGHDAVVIVCSANAGYVLPLTVMLTSLRANLPARRHLNIYIIDEDIPGPQKTHLRRSLDVDAVTISWHTADRSRLVGAPLWVELPVCVYNKLLVPDVLPEEVHTALWLNSDTLVLGDISPLWDEGIADSMVRAVQDPLVPLVSSDMGVARYRELGLQPDAKYFNCGVMLMNVRRWREQRVSDRALAYLKTYARDVAFCDQEGNRCGPLGPVGTPRPAMELECQCGSSVPTALHRRPRQDCALQRQLEAVETPWHQPLLRPVLRIHRPDRVRGMPTSTTVAHCGTQVLRAGGVRRMLLPSERWGIKVWRRSRLEL